MTTHILLIPRNLTLGVTGLLKTEAMLLYLSLRPGGQPSQKLEPFSSP